MHAVFGEHTDEMSQRAVYRRAMPMAALGAGAK